MTLKKLNLFLAKQYERWDFGYSVIGKGQIIVNWFILIKVYELSVLIAIIFIPVALLGVWFSGYLMDITGFRKTYMQRRLQGIKFEKEK